jgi:NAD(P)H-nitrite reductase large subunit
LKLKFNFTMMRLVMTCQLHPGAEPALDGGLPAAFTRALQRPMTRCECADVAFQEIARHMAASGSSLEEASRRTGCGQTCTACLPDLHQYLSRS